MIFWSIILVYAAGWLVAWRQLYRRMFAMWRQQFDDSDEVLLNALPAAGIAFLWPIILAVYPLYRWVTAEPRGSSDDGTS